MPDPSRPLFGARTTGLAIAMAGAIGLLQFMNWRLAAGMMPLVWAPATLLYVGLPIVLGLLILEARLRMTAELAWLVVAAWLFTTPLYQSLLLGGQPLESLAFLFACLGLLWLAPQEESRSAATLAVVTVALAIACDMRQLAYLPWFLASRTRTWRTRAILLVTTGAIGVALGEWGFGGAGERAALSAARWPNVWQMLASLFAAPDGLLSAAPLLWFGLIGMGALWRRDRRVAAIALSSFLLWWGIDAAALTHGARIGILPVLALGLAESLSLLRKSI
ncbi:MAG: hypothetical protein MUF51_09405, partial [Vicinamibacteria bacterium]|nr:hypothetical protein [Vicinamibacteria bacterium]